MVPHKSDKNANERLIQVASTKNDAVPAHIHRENSDKALQ